MFRQINFVNSPIVGIAVPKSFGERITGYFQLGNLSDREMLNEEAVGLEEGK